VQVIFQKYHIVAKPLKQKKRLSLREPLFVI